MSGRRSALLIVMALTAGLVGCVDPDDPRTNPKADHALLEWREVFPGTGRSDWLVVRGDADHDGDVLVLNPDARGRSVIVFGRPNLRDATIEVEVLRLAPEKDAGPYTVTTRLGGLLNWSGIYFVCRPESVEACRGSASKEFPDTEASGTFDKTTGVEKWRFEMLGQRIHCYRDGRKVVTYDDERPRAGKLAITADRCRVEIRRVRYRLGRQGL